MMDESTRASTSQRNPERRPASTTSGRVEADAIFAGKHLQFCRAPNGWEYAHRVDASQGVTMIALTGERKVVLVEQHRTPLGRNAIELPAGLVEGPEAGAEAIVAAAKRELREETGYTCERVEIVASGSSSPGLTDELNALCLMRGLRRADGVVEQVHLGGGITQQASPRGLAEEGERITVYEVPIEGAREWLSMRSQEGVVVDLKVFAGLYFAAAYTGE